MEIDEILSSKELAKLLSVTANKLTRLTRQRLPFVSLDRDGERKVFLKESVLKWLRSQEDQHRDSASARRGPR